MRDQVIEKGRMELHVDLAQPETVPDLFTKVRRELGTPSVVVYNGKPGLDDRARCSLSLCRGGKDTSISR